MWDFLKFSKLVVQNPDSEWVSVAAKDSDSGQSVLEDPNRGQYAQVQPVRLRRRHLPERGFVNNLKSVSFYMLEVVKSTPFHFLCDEKISLLI